MTNEMAAQRWERWKIARTALNLSERPLRTITDQRRLAQQASVKARRRNTHLRALRAREAEAELRRQVKEGIAFLTSRLITTSSRIDGIEEPVPREAALQPLFVHAANLKIVRAMLGTDPDWVRASETARALSRLISQPPSTWLSDSYLLIVAIRIEKVTTYDLDDPSAPNLYRVMKYYLKPHDLIEHHPRPAGRGKPAEAVPWAPLLPLPIVYLNNLRAPSPRRLVKEIVDAWVSWERSVRLPWAASHVAEPKSSTDPPPDHRLRQ